MRCVIYKTGYSSQTTRSPSFYLGILKTAEHATERKNSPVRRKRLRRLPSRERTRLVSTRAISRVLFALVKNKGVLLVSALRWKQFYKMFVKFNSNSAWNARTPLHELLEIFGASTSWVNKLNLQILFFFFLQMLNRITSKHILSLAGSWY